MPPFVHRLFRDNPFTLDGLSQKSQLTPRLLTVLGVLVVVGAPVASVIEAVLICAPGHGPTSLSAPLGLCRSHHRDGAGTAGARRRCSRRALEHGPAAPMPVGTPVRARTRRRAAVSAPSRRRPRRSSPPDAARHDVLDGYRASNTTAATSTSAARAAVTSPPSLVLRGSARRCRRPCRPRV